MIDLAERIVICHRCRFGNALGSSPRPQTCDRDEQQRTIVAMAEGGKCPEGFFDGEPVLPPPVQMASAGIVKLRLSICRGCEHFRDLGEKGTCINCGCDLAEKTSIAASRCPVGKW